MRRSRRSRWVWWAQPLCWWWGTVAGQPCPPESPADLDSLVHSHMEREGIAGMSMAVIRQGEVVLLKGYGWADQEHAIPATDNTVYRWASLSKVVTAVATLKAWEEGKLDLQADIRTYVPEYPAPQEGSITAERLLACEAGIQQYAQRSPFDLAALHQYMAAHPDDFHAEDAISVFRDQPLLAPPGTTFNYSTFSFNLLALVVERAVGQPFETYVQETIIDPLRLPYLQPEYGPYRPFPHQTSWYWRHEGKTLVDKATHDDHHDISWKLPGGGYTGTIVDLAAFTSAWLKGDLVSDSTRLRMCRTRRIGGRPTYYGLGVFTSSFEGRDIASQFGHQPGTRTLLYADPAAGDAILLLSNTYGTDLLPLAKDLFRDISRFDDAAPCDSPFPDELGTVLWKEEEGSGSLAWAPVPGATQYRIGWVDSSGRQGTEVVMDSTWTWRGDPGDPLTVKVRAEAPFLHGGSLGPWSEKRMWKGRGDPALPVRRITDDFLRPHGIAGAHKKVWRPSGARWHAEAGPSRIRMSRWSLGEHGGWTFDRAPGKVDTLRWVCRIPLAPDPVNAYRLTMTYRLHAPWEAMPAVQLAARSGEEGEWRVLAADLGGAGPETTRKATWDLLHTGGDLSLRLAFDLRHWPASVWFEPVMTLEAMRIRPQSEE